MQPPCLRSKNRFEEAAAVSAAKLTEDTLGFYGSPKTRDSGLEMVVPAPGKAVWECVMT
jgi:hypothetical protein